MKATPEILKRAGMAVVRAVVAFSIFRLIGFAVVQTSQRLGAGWAVTHAAETVAAVAGTFIAFRLRSAAVGFFLAGQCAFSVAELTIHLIYGIRAAQGAATHFAVMLAGTLGVALGAVITVRLYGRGADPHAVAQPREQADEQGQARAA
jgi:hypothetical protein